MKMSKILGTYHIEGMGLAQHNIKNKDKRNIILELTQYNEFCKCTYVFCIKSTVVLASIR